MIRVLTNLYSSLVLSYPNTGIIYFPLVGNFSVRSTRLWNPKELGCPEMNKQAFLVHVWWITSLVCLVVCGAVVLSPLHTTIVICKPGAPHLLILPTQTRPSQPAI
jgi:hypothetical protein